MDLKDLADEEYGAQVGPTRTTAPAARSEPATRILWPAEPAGVKWLLLDSKLLDGEHILLVFEKPHLQEARQAHPGTVIYFPPEVEELKRLKDHPDTLKLLHRIKKEFGAWIVPSNHKRIGR